MNTEKFENVLNERINKCLKTLSVKADEYATEDRLHNFKIAAELQNCTPITALAGMMAKHTHVMLGVSFTIRPKRIPGRNESVFSGVFKQHVSKLE